MVLLDLWAVTRLRTLSFLAETPWAPGPNEENLPFFVSEGQKGLPVLLGTGMWQPVPGSLGCVCLSSLGGSSRSTTSSTQSTLVTCSWYRYSNQWKLLCFWFKSTNNERSSENSKANPQILYLLLDWPAASTRCLVAFSISISMAVVMFFSISSYFQNCELPQNQSLINRWIFILQRQWGDFLSSCLMNKNDFRFHGGVWVKLVPVELRPLFFLLDTSKYSRALLLPWMRPSGEVLLWTWSATDQEQ